MIPTDSWCAANGGNRPEAAPGWMGGEPARGGKRWRQAVRSGVKAALALTFGPAVGPWPRVLMYHSVDWSGSPISITPEQFRQQMAWLKAWGWQTLPLSQAFEAARGPRRRGVVLTFDDGFANFYHEVFPILREFGMTAAVFVVTDYVGGWAEWLARDREVTETLVGSLPLDPAERALWIERLLGLATEPLLTWPQIQELAVAGIEFHAHTASHPLLSRLSPGEVEQEIRGCQHALAAALGPQPRFFAYPYGVPTPMARTTLTALGCPGALLAIPSARIWGGAHDAMAIPRVGIPGTASPSDFRFRLSRAVALASRSWQVGGKGMHRG